MSPKRNSGGRSPPDPLDEIEFSDASRRELTQPGDPAEAVARSMLDRAFAQVGIDPLSAPVCVVLVPSDLWLPVMPPVWQKRLMNDGVSADLDGRGGWWHAEWLYFSRRAAGAANLRAGNDEVARAVWEQLPLVGFTDDPASLPTDLVRVSELTVEISAPTPFDVTQAALSLLGNEPNDILNLHEAALLTPRLLRLATRSGQTADGWVARLRHLLALERADLAELPSSKSPRAAPDLSRLHGMPEAVAWGTALAADVAAYRRGELPWSAVDGGCLLSGPPGVGKTLFARSLARTCEMTLVVGSYSIWHSAGQTHQGDFLKAMRKAFVEAKADAPSILFVDEIDSFPDREKVTHRWASYERQVVNAFLAEIDGADDRDGVVLIGACNHPDRLDPALVRSGRLDRHIRLSLPNLAALAAILREHLGDDLPGQDLSGVAAFAAGSSGADCERIVRGARRRARLEQRPVVVADLLAELSGDLDVPDDVLHLTAVHEAGHVVAALETNSVAIEAVSLRSTDTRGGAAALRSTDTGFVTAADVRSRLMLLLAGRAAEEVVFGIVTSGAGGGAGSDLAKATVLATDAALALGLDADNGLLWLGETDPQRLAELLAVDPKLAPMVRERLATAYVAAVELVARHRGLVEAIAAALVARGSLDAREIAALATAFGERP